MHERPPGDHCGGGVADTALGGHEVDTATQDRERALLCIVELGIIEVEQVRTEHHREVRGTLHGEADVGDAYLEELALVLEAACQLDEPLGRDRREQPGP